MNFALKELDNFLSKIYIISIEHMIENNIQNKINDYIKTNNIPQKDLIKLFEHYTKELTTNINKIKHQNISYNTFKKISYDANTLENKIGYIISNMTNLIMSDYNVTKEQIQYFANSYKGIESLDEKNLDEIRFNNVKDLLFFHIFSVIGLKTVKEIINKYSFIYNELSNQKNDIITIVQTFDEKDVEKINNLIATMNEINNLLINFPQYCIDLIKGESENYVHHLQNMLKIISYLKDIIIFKNLPKNECIEKIRKHPREWNDFSKFNWTLSNPKYVCDSKVGTHIQPRFNPRTFLKNTIKDEDENESSEVCNVDHYRRMTMMGINFESTFSKYVCSNIHVYLEHFSKKTVTGKHHLQGDIMYYNKNMSINNESWSKTSNCHQEFHKNGKPLLVKILVYAHIYCMFIFPKTKICEIWDTGSINSSGIHVKRDIAHIFKKILPDYDIFIIGTHVQTTLKSDKQIKYDDKYCQTWIYLFAFLRLVLGYSRNKIILYLLSMTYENRLDAINTFQTQLSNDGNGLKYLNVVQDMMNEGWKDRYETIYKNLELLNEQTFISMLPELEYIVQRETSGFDTSKELYFKDFFWETYTEGEYDVIDHSFITETDLNVLYNFFNPIIIPPLKPQETKERKRITKREREEETLSFLPRDDTQKKTKDNKTSKGGFKSYNKKRKLYKRCSLCLKRHI